MVPSQQNSLPRNKLNQRMRGNSSKLSHSFRTSDEFLHAAKRVSKLQHMELNISKRLAAILAANSVELTEKGLRKVFASKGLDCFENYKGLGKKAQDELITELSRLNIPFDSTKIDKPALSKYMLNTFVGNVPKEKFVQELQHGYRLIAQFPNEKFWRDLVIPYKLKSLAYLFSERGQKLLQDNTGATFYKLAEPRKFAPEPDCKDDLPKFSGQPKKFLSIKDFLLTRTKA